MRRSVLSGFPGGSGGLDPVSKPVIALDGPAGSGKSTVARALARRLGVRHIDTGAMYRALALKLLRAGTDPALEDAVIALLEATQIEVSDGRVELDGSDVGALIRTEQVTGASSRVAQVGAVRRWMVQRQRAIVRAGDGAVVEGRDIGAVVLPEARLKIYLTASEPERARRRSVQSGSPAGKTRSQIALRDERDAGRTHSPLRPADDAVLVDTTELTVDQVVEQILQLLAGRQVTDD